MEISHYKSSRIWILVLNNQKIVSTMQFRMVNFRIIGLFSDQLSMDRILNNYAVLGKKTLTLS